MQHLRQKFHLVGVALFGEAQGFAEPVERERARGRVSEGRENHATASAMGSHQRCTAFATTLESLPACCAGRL